MNRPAIIHPTAIVAPEANLGAGVEVGPYCIIEGNVDIGDDTRIGPYTLITGRTRIGRGNHIHGWCSLGDAPQDKKYAGEDTMLEIGDHNVIREFCTMNRGTVQDDGVTRLGSHNWIMAYVHLAHDCRVGNHTIFANNAQLAGHVHIADHVVLGGYTGVHQFCRIGVHANTGVGCKVLQDVPPFVKATGNPASPRGINREGLRRAGLDATTIEEIRQAYKDLYRRGLLLAQAREAIAARLPHCAAIAPLLEFLDHGSGRGIIR